VISEINGRAQTGQQKQTAGGFEMKAWIKMIGFAGLVAVLAGCTNSTVATKRGTAGGAATGAVVGGVIGHQKGKGLEGAAIGAAAGGAGGALLGSARDEAISGKK
jgi:hypothetical protein